MIHVYIIANDSLVCFSWSCFLKPVWHTRVFVWSSNGSNVNRQISTQLEIARLTRRLGYQIGYYLWYLEHKWVSGEAFCQCQLTSTCGKIHHFYGSPPTWPSPLYDHLWYWCKNYLKWWEIQLAVLCRVCQLKDIV